MGKVTISKPNKKKSVTATVKEKIVKLSQGTYDKLLADITYLRKELLAARGELSILKAYRKSIRTQLDRGVLVHAESFPRATVFGYHYPPVDPGAMADVVVFPCWPGLLVAVDDVADLNSAIKDLVELHIEDSCEMICSYQEPPMTVDTTKYRVDVNLATGKVVLVKACE